MQCKRHLVVRFCQIVISLLRFSSDLSFTKRIINIPSITFRILGIVNRRFRYFFNIIFRNFCIVLWSIHGWNITRLFGYLVIVISTINLRASIVSSYGQPPTNQVVPYRLLTMITRLCCLVSNCRHTAYARLTFFIRGLERRCIFS